MYSEGYVDSRSTHDQNSHNSLPHLARDFMDGLQAITMPTFPISLPSFLIALSPVLKEGLGYRKDRHEQNKGRGSRKHPCQRHGVRLVAYINTYRFTSVSQNQSIKVSLSQGELAYPLSTHNTHTLTINICIILTYKYLFYISHSFIETSLRRL